MISIKMLQRAGLLYLSKKNSKVFFVLENHKWTVPTFTRKESLLSDAESLLDNLQRGKIIPIELYLSEDQGFEYGTYICLVDEEFIPRDIDTYCWSSLDKVPGNLHSGLKTTLNNKIIRIKIDTIMELENAVK